jgi:uncharacterized protein YjbI with pentapeptide repeats
VPVPGRSRGAGVLVALVAVVVLLVVAALPAGVPAAPTGAAPRAAAATAGADDVPCPPKPSNVRGRRFTGDLSHRNFSRQDLTNADFSGATLKGTTFLHARLEGADFSGATIVADDSPAALPTDFTFADLTNACFQRVRFQGRTYFTYATLTCADFSGSPERPADLSAHAIFGDRPLRFDSNACRPAFRYAVMNCEFVAQWPALDLSHATGLQACASQLRGRDFSRAVLDFADLRSMDLSNTTWTGASLRHAKFDDSTLDNAKGLDGASGTLLAGASFNKVSAKMVKVGGVYVGVDFSGARLNGADFSYAELQGANFSGAVLVNDPENPLGPIEAAAKFDGAHLQYVSFRGATLNSVSFKYASLYGAMLGAPPASCQTTVTRCPAASRTGATCSCAAMSNANLTRTDFSNAFLYGVDFSSAKVNGTTFTGAVLVGANFLGAAFSTDTSQGGKSPTMDGAWLQGVNLQGADLTDVSLANARVDFGVVDGNGTRPSGRLALLLATGHTQFRDWTGSKTPCVYVENPDASSLPTDIGSMTCPDGRSYTGGCGALLPRNGTAATNPRWFGGTVSSALPIRGWYRRQSTYEDAAAPSVQCNGQPVETRW